jgi:hypothetical protein
MWNLRLHFAGTSARKAAAPITRFLNARRTGLDPKLAIPIAGDEPSRYRSPQTLVRDVCFGPSAVGKLAAATYFQMAAFGLRSRG